MAAIAALIGLALGQVLHLVFDRLYTDRPWAAPLQRCRSRLAWRSLILPAGSATVFAVSALVFDDFGPALLAGTFAAIFLVLTLTDMDRRLIPDRVVYPAVLLAAGLSWAWPDTSVAQVFAGGLVAAVIAGGLLLFSLPFGANAYGLGDVKMIVLTGLVVGLPSVIIGVFVGT